MDPILQAEQMKRFLIAYLLLSGLVANLIVIGTISLIHESQWHKSSQFLLRQMAQHHPEWTHHIDSIREYLTSRVEPGSFENWPFQGASTRQLARQRYSATGHPLTTTEGAYVALGRILSVNSSAQLQQALLKARKGDTIDIQPGSYRLQGRRIRLRHAGTPQQPIHVRTGHPGTVVLELNTLEGFLVDRPYWVFENLHIQGTCNTDDYCEHAFHVVGNARGFVLRNNHIRGFNAALKVNSLWQNNHQRLPDHGLVTQNTIGNSRTRNTGNPVTLLNINSASHWTVRRNILHDFAKGRSNRVSYGAFMKGNASHGLMEQNLVACSWLVADDGGTRIGLSLGGGGSGANRYCRDGDCSIEHNNGTIRNNIIINCNNDVGIYLNKASNSRIHHNLLLNTRGIDVRYPQSTADVSNNIVDGGIFLRDSGSVSMRQNLISADCGHVRHWFSPCGIEDWFHNPKKLDLRLHSKNNLVDQALTIPANGAGKDFCGRSRTLDEADIGPIEYDAAPDCLPETMQRPR